MPPEDNKRGEGKCRVVLNDEGEGVIDTDVLGRTDSYWGMRGGEEAIVSGVVFAPVA